MGNAIEHVESVAKAFVIKFEVNGLDPNILEPIINKARNAKNLKDIRFVITDTKLSLSYTIIHETSWVEETKWCMKLEK